jgi:hypothetical protein
VFLKGFLSRVRLFLDHTTFEIEVNQHSDRDRDPIVSSWDEPICQSNLKRKLVEVLR